MSASLYDSNLWVALAFAAHPHARLAASHFAELDSDHLAAFCRATQQSFLRLVTTPALQRAYGAPMISNASAWEKCDELLSLPQILWLDEPEGLSVRWHQLADLPSASPKVWMDAYLAAFAIGHELEFVTLDGDFERFVKDGLRLRVLSE